MNIGKPGYKKRKQGMQRGIDDTNKRQQKKGIPSLGVHERKK
jgi:hypothetical protein